MSIIIPANSAVSGGFSVANSLMFNSADSAYLSKTFGSAGTRTKYTISLWVKRSKVGATQCLFSAGTGSNNSMTITFNGNDTLYWNSYSGDGANYDYFLDTTRKFRDVSAWYHIVCAFDSTQGTSSNRMKIYINGVQETSFVTETYPGSYSDYAFNNILHEIGQDVGAGSRFFDGYMAEYCGIDGLQLTPTSFGEFEEDSEIWQPIDVSELTFGTNGFYLDFEDSSALGDDAAGSNDFATNNLAATDQGTDTCTNNFSTLNLLATSSYATLSQGNNTVQGNSAANSAETFSTFSTGNNGKWYYEIKCTARGGVGNPTIGFIHTARGFRLQNGEPGLGGATNGSLDIRVQPDGKTFDNGAASGSAVISTYTAGDILGFAIDSDNGAFYVSKNGVWQTSGNPESGASRTGAIKTWSPTDSKVTEGQSVCIGVYNTATVADANFGSPHFAITSGNADGNSYGDFEFAVPTGYFALCTKNLAEYG